MYENDHQNAFVIAVETKQDATTFVEWQKKNPITVEIWNDKYDKIHGSDKIPFSVKLIS
jgi:hypothetical protein